MRPIKFKVWAVLEKRWLGYEQLSANPQSKIETLEWHSSGIDGTPTGVGFFGGVEGLIRVQYTGLHDKNGKEIYEGDIVQGVVQFPQLTTMDDDDNSNVKMAGEVFYDSSGFELKAIQRLCDEEREGMVNYFSFIGCEGEIFRQMEVIGNIYENPDLLSV